MSWWGLTLALVPVVVLLTWVFYLLWVLQREARELGELLDATDKRRAR